MKSEKATEKAREVKAGCVIGSDQLLSSRLLRVTGRAHIDGDARCEERDGEGVEELAAHVEARVEALLLARELGGDLGTRLARLRH